MEITNHEIVGTINYFTVKSENKLIKVEKVLEVIKNIQDYIDNDGIADQECIREDILQPRDYLVTIEGDFTSCTCKGSLFNKSNCRHINMALQYLKDGGIKNEQKNS